MKLLPDSIKLFLINRLLEIIGISAILLSLFILISVASHSNYDPSIFNLNNYEVKNIGGYLGANISETLLQVFGYSSFIIGLAVSYSQTTGYGGLVVCDASSDYFILDAQL